MAGEAYFIRVESLSRRGVFARSWKIPSRSLLDRKTSGEVGVI